MNKKLLIWIFVMVVLVSSVSAQTLLAQDDNERNVASYEWGRATQLKELTQSIRFNNTGTVTSLEVFAKEVGDAGDSYRVSLEMNGSSVPSGTLVSPNATVSGDFSSFFDGTGNWYNFTFNGSFEVNASQDYWITWKVDSEVDGNYYFVGYDSGDTYPQGDNWRRQDGGAWISIGNDFNFKVWATGTPAPVADTINLTNPNPLNNSRFLVETIAFNVTGNFSDNVNVTLYINGEANETQEVSAGNDVFVNFTKTFDVGDFNYSFTANHTNESETTTTLYFEVDFPLLDNCSTYTTVASNFTLYNETSNTLINGSFNGYFEIASTDYNASFNLTWGDSWNFGVCIHPEYAEVTSNAQMEYGAEGFETRTYYFDDVTLNNQTSYISLYLTGGTSTVTFSVIDENSDAVSGAYISVLKYDFAKNSYTTSEVLRTDSQGDAVGNIVLSSVWYKFIITYNGEIYLETEPTKILTTTYNFQINLGSDYFDTYTVVDGISCTMEFDNASKCFTYTFSDPTGASNYGCVDVVRRGLNRDFLLNSSCETDSSATIVSCIAESVGANLYVATGYITKEGYTFTCATEDVGFGRDFERFGTEGILMTFLLTLTLIMIGIWNPIIAIMLMIIGIVASVLLKIFFLSWGVLVAFIIIGIITIYRMNRQ